MWHLVRNWLLFSFGAGLTVTGFISGLSAGEREEKLIRLVRQDCGSCHGLTLKGGLGRPLLPEALRYYDEEMLSKVILDGLAGTPMPPWRPLMSERDALWIAVKLKEGFPQ